MRGYKAVDRSAAVPPRRGQSVHRRRLEGSGRVVLQSVRCLWVDVTALDCPIDGQEPAAQAPEYVFDGLSTTRSYTDQAM